MRAIKTKFIGPTNFRESRIKAIDGNKNSIVIPWAHGVDAEENHVMAAKALIKKMNWKGQLVSGSLDNCYVHVMKSE